MTHLGRIVRFCPQYLLSEHWERGNPWQILGAGPSPTTLICPAPKNMAIMVELFLPRIRLITTSSFFFPLRFPLLCQLQIHLPQPCAFSNS